MRRIAARLLKNGDASRNALLPNGLIAQLKVPMAERRVIGNHILCTRCFEGYAYEEKCCGHGAPVLGPQPTCVACGKQRDASEPPWHCLGTMFEDKKESVP